MAARSSTSRHWNCWRRESSTLPPDGLPTTFPTCDLRLANADDQGISICYTDGSLVSAGRFDEPFTIQSISKTVALLYALEQLGPKQVFGRVGKEPTGEPSLRSAENDFPILLPKHLDVFQPGLSRYPQILGQRQGLISFLGLEVIKEGPGRHLVLETSVVPGGSPDDSRQAKLLYSTFDNASFRGHEIRIGGGARPSASILFHSPSVRRSDIGCQNSCGNSATIAIFLIQVLDQCHLV